MIVPTTTPIDDFLAGAGRISASGARWESIGLGVALGGTILAVGALVILGAVHSGRRSEVRVLLFVAMLAGAAMAIGAAIELGGTARVLGIGWIDVLTGGSASSALLRLLGGVLVLVGLGDETRPAAGPIGEADVESSADVRWVPGASSAFGLVGVALGVLSFAFDGHTVSQGPRLVHAAVNVVHVTAGGIWAGGVVTLVVLAAVRPRHEAFGHLLARFSPLATAALAAVFVAGAAMAAIILDAPTELTNTEWGRRLLVKTIAVGAAAMLGAYHHHVVRSGRSVDDRTVRRVLALEAALLTVVVVLSALLTRSSIVAGSNLVGGG